jgi:hypothetical protein
MPFLLTTVKKKVQKGLVDCRALIELIDDHDPVLCVIEEPGGFSRNAHSVGKQWLGYGQLIGMLQAIGLPFHTVNNRGKTGWKTVLELGTDKQDAIALARRYLPDLNLRRTPKCTTDHDGLAEAGLLACLALQRYDLLHGDHQ